MLFGGGGVRRPKKKGRAKRAAPKKAGRGGQPRSKRPAPKKKASKKGGRRRGADLSFGRGNGLSAIGRIARTVGRAAAGGGGRGEDN